MSFLLNNLGRAARNAKGLLPKRIQDNMFLSTILGGAGTAVTAPLAWDYLQSRRSGSPAVDAAAETLRHIWPAAMATTIASGAAGGLLASRTHNPGETKEERRRRILNTALMTGAAGGAAVTSIPVGKALLENPATYRDKYGSGGIFNVVGDNALGLGKTFAGLAAGVTAAKFGIPLTPLKGGLGRMNKAVRTMAGRHIADFGQELGKDGGQLPATLQRLLANAAHVGSLSADDKALMQILANELPDIGARMRTGGRLTTDDMTVLRSLEGDRGRLSDQAKILLNKEYGIRDTAILDPKTIDNLPTLARQAGLMDYKTVSKPQRFFDFVNPSVNRDDPAVPFNKVIDLDNPSRHVGTWTAPAQIGTYVGAGLGGQALWQSAVPAI